MVKTVTVDDLAIVHSGDKGDGCNVAIIPYRYEDYDFIVDQVTAARIKALYGPLVKGEVKRHLLPGTRIVNFWLHQGNDGGSSRSLIVDRHAIARSSLALTLNIEVPDSWRKPFIDQYGRVTN